MTMCVNCNATEGHYHPQYGWHLCGNCYEEYKKREEFDAMPDVVVVYENESGRDWMTKDEWDASVRYSPNVVGKAIYKKVEEV